VIVQITHENIGDINKANGPFEVIGKIIPKYENDTWTYTEEIYPEVHEKQYPHDVEDYEAYINSKDKTVFFFYDNDMCIGQIKIHKNWGRYAFIDDLMVIKNARGKGVGHALINQAIEWAKQNQLMGLTLETQDNNLWACRFYSKCGFRIGGIDDMLYDNFPDIADEKAIFWYLKW
jgi:streptothricin acetyltransferase